MSSEVNYDATVRMKMFGYDSEYDEEEYYNEDEEDEEDEEGEDEEEEHNVIEMLELTEEIEEKAKSINFEDCDQFLREIFKELNMI